ncbi:hypothetical protein TPHA_0O01290 [Tetrapisispora phaffii CBS 4417]|uniref:Uncharacterized protein n=1 Tax=Tetrapisispora phaffii (strain ATCC 24235 / CBS 4417 / NBRC 1672 / NRRL Y-8282 / UCD 70-5) TaxID=1071381 RepID=G8C1R9_TETPH|nr:hypothetical protein TPHA_0O01290 [Tetrapisispora phaffii CBS 4417]CCE66097.1 hypothetical protein TPHA_0O01290 [Tetrapisispora phaffii CBS 4417]
MRCQQVRVRMKNNFSFFEGLDEFFEKEETEDGVAGDAVRSRWIACVRWRVARCHGRGHRQRQESRAAVRVALAVKGQEVRVSSPVRQRCSRWVVSGMYVCACPVDVGCRRCSIRNCLAMPRRCNCVHMRQVLVAGLLVCPLAIKGPHSLHRCYPLSLCLALPSIESVLSSIGEARHRYLQ